MADLNSFWYLWTPCLRIELKDYTNGNVSLSAWADFFQAVNPGSKPVRYIDIGIDIDILIWEY
jgi:hypothetical protein